MRTMNHRPRRRFVASVGIVLIAGFLTSCDGVGDLSGTWTLDGASIAEGSLGPIAQVETTPYLSMDEGELNGNAGCNDFAGSYEVRGSVITFDEVWMEAKGCDPISNAYDLFFGQIFGSEVEVQTGSDWMTWSSEDNELRFVPSTAEDS